MAWVAPFVLWFPCCELTCCRTQHKPNVGMTMWMSQLLFFQVQNCCPPPPAAPPVLLSPDTPLVVTTVFIPWWGGSGAHTLIHLLTAVCGNMNVSERGREGGAQWKDEVFLVFGREKIIKVPCWAFISRLMGPDSAEYTEGQQGSTLTFLFTQSTVWSHCEWVVTCTVSIPVLKKLTVDEWMNKLLWFSCYLHHTNTFVVFVLKF